MNAVENLLRENLGLDIETIGASLVDRVVRSRMRHFGLAKKDDYANLLQSSPEEWEALVESVVITETWFFREKFSFLAMVRFVRDEWVARNPVGTLRLLSLPCSSGEEPYSMAMALLEAGMCPSSFSIDAIDISARSIAYAEDGVYGRNSFRGSDLAFRNKYFLSEGQEYRLSDPVRAQVKFQGGNVLDNRCLAAAGPYDVIFFRNLLIYLDQQTRGKLLMKIREHLAPSGVVFFGPAEVPLALSSGYAFLNCPLSFACRHPDFARTLPEPRLHFRKPHLSLFGANGSDSKHLPMPPVLPTGLGDFSGKTILPTDLGTARRMAEQGRLTEAAEICETHLRTRGVSADAYYLLGLLQNAAGADSQAGEFYRRALYLEPDHYDSLIQWASLSKRHGNETQARRLRERAERVKKQT